jgi:hypothetical protein
VRTTVGEDKHVNSRSSICVALRLVPRHSVQEPSAHDVTATNDVTITRLAQLQVIMVWRGTDISCHV